MTTFLAWRHRAAVESIAALTVAGPFKSVRIEMDATVLRPAQVALPGLDRHSSIQACLRLLLSDVRRHCSNRFHLFRLTSSTRPPILGRIWASI